MYIHTKHGWATAKGLYTNIVTVMTKIHLCENDKEDVYKTQRGYWPAEVSDDDDF